MFSHKSNLRQKKKDNIIKNSFNVEKECILQEIHYFLKAMLSSKHM